MCYANKEGLKERQRQIQEAEKRDHKKIGKEMELYMIDEMIGKGYRYGCLMERFSNQK